MLITIATSQLILILFCSSTPYLSTLSFHSHLQPQPWHSPNHNPIKPPSLSPFFSSPFFSSPFFSSPFFSCSHCSTVLKTTVCSSKKLPHRSHDAVAVQKVTAKMNDFAVRSFQKTQHQSPWRCGFSKTNHLRTNDFSVWKLRYMTY
jgi:hypothetical protein